MGNRTAVFTDNVKRKDVINYTITKEGSRALDVAKVTILRLVRASGSNLIPYNSELKIIQDEIGVENLEGYWIFEDHSLDGSGYDRHLVEHSVTYVTGKNGKGVNLAGATTNYLDYANYPFPTDSVDIALHIKTSQSPSVESVILDYSVTNEFREFSVGMNVNGKINLYVGGDQLFTDAGIALNDNVFHYLRISWDKVTGHARLYVDDVLQATSSIIYSESLSTNGYLLIGQLYGTGGALGNFRGGSGNFRTGTNNFRLYSPPNQIVTGRSFNGIIDDLRIYGRTLSVADGTKLYGVSKVLNILKFGGKVNNLGDESSSATTVTYEAKSFGKEIGEKIINTELYTNQTAKQIIQSLIENKTNLDWIDNTTHTSTIIGKYVVDGNLYDAINELTKMDGSDFHTDGWGRFIYETLGST